jgi:hypothetical protein
LSWCRVSAVGSRQHICATHAARDVGGWRIAKADEVGWRYG